MIDTNPADPHTQRRERIEAVCKQLINAEGAAHGMTHDEFLNGYGLLPDLYLRGIVAGLGEGAHYVSIHLNHEQDRLLATMNLVDGHIGGERDHVLYMTIASRAAGATTVVTARTEQPNGLDLFQAWKLEDGYPLPLLAPSAAEFARKVRREERFVFADAFDPEVFLHRALGRKPGF
ncbi:hypothetical protein [Streptomyces sp. NBC_00582]|uniref:hypothetical protein n=1 Tax=Streptomyces sp. NBC_00582 TaxID=2975783 RepID=UPI002E80BFBF|nr:hypothetical protein [Streptomyces sp. NBC_00582]WUB68590.1 hypothetical protein OG852_50725 [Streptomyces sp. NBC_00582]